MDNLDVMKTRKLDLCLLCEICSSVCVVYAVMMEYTNSQFLPKVDEDRCTKCGLCL